LEIALANDKEVRLCVFVDPFMDPALTLKFLGDNNFSKEIKGLELIIGKTDWEDTDSDEEEGEEEQSEDAEKEEKEKVDKTDALCYGDKIKPLIEGLKSLDSVRITRQNHYQGKLFDDADFENLSVKKLYFDATVI
jgi:hypothetical protein